MSKLREVTELGQSIWLDYIRRAFVDSGELQELIEAGVRGVTSNPSIFEKAITGSADYDEALSSLASMGTTEAIYEALAIEDIQRAADLFRPLYDESDGGDGYVSLEADPRLAYNVEGTVEEARRLFRAVGRPNVMIKVPATAAGIPAIASLIGEGINVNVTLMFSRHHYEAVADAYLRGLERLAAEGGDLSRVASVASFFISRVDTVVDARLDELVRQGVAGAAALRGQIGIANAKMVYARYLTLFSSERWQRLAAQGARPQRLLWGSTGVKDPAYPDTLYVDHLMGANTVNTLPPETLRALQSHATIASGLTAELEVARASLVQLGALGIDLDLVTQQLQDDGVRAFAHSFAELLAGIEEKRRRLQANHEEMDVWLGQYQETVDGALAEMRRQEIMKRIWAYDHTVWRPEPKDITNRLGWLHMPEQMPEHVGRIQALVDEVQAEGYNHVLLLGMGGSSLAPELFSKIFGMAEGGLPVSVLDNTDPGAVLAYDEQLDLDKTLYIVATKSGGTVETLSFFKYFYNRVLETTGSDQAGRHFIAITDAGSRLDDLAQQHNFRATFRNFPTIGGRYSVLSYFGLVPAAFSGVDLHRLLARAQEAADNAASCNCPVNGDNRAAQLGAIMGELAKAGRDKVTFITSPPIASFGDWLEQLIAESTGKDGAGILPIVGEPVGRPSIYGDDRLFVYLRLDGDETYDEAVTLLREAGLPLVILYLRDRYDLGGQFFLWEMATAVAGYRLGIQPFNQPNVEQAKVLARQTLAEYQKKGQLPELETAPLAAEVLHGFLEQAQPGDYIALQAFVQPSAEAGEALQALRLGLRDQYRLATTLGFGPRFLHSTGQLHKGDRGNGLFIQFTSDSIQDVPIPDEAGKPESSVTFGVLKMAQALGDAQALLNQGRRLLRFHLGTDVVGGLAQLVVE